MILSSMRLRHRSTLRSSRASICCIAWYAVVIDDDDDDVVVVVVVDGNDVDVVLVLVIVVVVVIIIIIIVVIAVAGFISIRLCCFTTLTAHSQTNLQLDDVDWIDDDDVETPADN